MTKFKDSFLPQSIQQWILLVLPLLGLADAVYLTIEKLSGGVVYCSVLNGCSQVLNSSYSVFFGVPISAIGILFYVVVFILAVGLFYHTADFWLGALLGIETLGTVISLALVLLQVFAIWCVLSILFALSADNIYSVWVYYPAGS